jgi:signal recognition particle subunit SEC65
MRNGILVVALIASAVCLAGCLIISSDEEVIRMPDDPAIAEINAISKLSFDNDRQHAYKRIAAREGLSEAAQVHLVKEALDNLSFEAAKEDVLLTLIRNPGFASAAESAILMRLNKFSFESSKNKILEAINQRRAQAPSAV